MVCSARPTAFETLMKRRPTIVKPWHSNWRGSTRTCRYPSDSIDRAPRGSIGEKTKGIAWFRDDAQEHISRMHEIKRVLEAHGHVVHVLTEDRIGYVVYEDAAQVIAEPFADTRTGHEE